MIERHFPRRIGLLFLALFAGLFGVVLALDWFATLVTMIYVFAPAGVAWLPDSIFEREAK